MKGVENYRYAPPPLKEVNYETREAHKPTAASLAPAVGDVNSSAKGSGARFNAGKVPFHMVPLHLLEGAARVFQKATQRPINPYPKWNWAKGMSWSVPIDCIKRHLAKIERGEDVDEETGELHISHLICNALMLEHYYQTYREGDDRPTLFKPKETK